ncbi:hypothetical protein Scep_008243 [Stephania cephalantha]|uniref:Uncharacterized protein n=1 Tax=Stephania cephalantha TaxID=152367 RepID=A0AAP0PQS0_9MAGN
MKKSVKTVGDEEAAEKGKKDDGHAAAAPLSGGTAPLSSFGKSRCLAAKIA